MEISPLERARRAQTARASDPALQLTAKLMADDQWANGAGWVGPEPRPNNSEDYARVAGIISEVEKGFVSRNLLDNVVSRHVAGIAGREPLWSVEEAEDVERALAEWWDRSGVWLAIQKALKTAVWSGKGTVRLFIPSSKLVELGQEGQRGIPSGTDLTGALRYISVHAPEWDQAGVFRDHEQRVLGSYYSYVDKEGQSQLELQLKGKEQTQVIPTAVTGAETASTVYPVSQLLLFEVSLDPLVKESLRRLSMFANKVLSMGSRNIDLGGFTERTIMNAQMPGEWKGNRFVPSAYHVGAGVTNFLSGIALHERNPTTGEIEPTGGFSNPSIQYKDPSSWAIFGDSLNAIREAIFDEAKQLHVLITGDASASGVSRVQAVQDFLSSLEPTRIALEQLVRWVLNTVLKLATHFTGAATPKHTISVQARISAVQPTPQEIDSALQLHERGLISQETAHAKMGIEDSKAELKRIETEGITPALAMRLAEAAPAPFIAMRALQIGFPALGIQDADVSAQRAIDLADASDEPDKAPDSPPPKSIDG